MHHPSRKSESGEVERTGANQEVWVDFNYPGTGPTAGDFGDPFRTLADAQNAVAVGGTIEILPGLKNEPIVLSRRMTLKSFPGSAIISRQ
jgi:hypothetical protein